jgi:lysophospholipase L1-like esterase
VAVTAVVLAATLAGCAGSAAPAARKPPAGHRSGKQTPAPRASTATPATAPLAGGGPRIMIIGDSITQGSAGDYTWQYWLYEHLRADGVKPTMVGPYGWLYNNVTDRQHDQSYANPDFEHANDAIWGLTLFREKAEIGSEVTTYRPDYLLVMLGLNDLFWYEKTQSVMTQNLAGFIAAARTADPRIRIVLGLVPPDIHQRTNPFFAASVTGFNQTITATAAEESTAASPIAVADDGARISITKDLWDGTHPNTNGQIKIAAAFADVLARRFRLGKPYPAPFPVMPTGPLVSPHLIVRPSLTPHEAVLIWTLVPGANSYLVYEKDTTEHGAKFKRLPYPLSPTQNPWRAGLLTAGSIYTFKLQACKGNDCGAYSNQASVTAP